MKRNYFKSIFIRLSFIYLKIKLYYLNKKVTSGNGKIIIYNPFLKVKIIVQENAQFILNGNLKIVDHIGGVAPVYIFLSKNSCLKIQGDFLIGNGVRIYLYKDSNLTIGGKQFESESGITENTKVMVYDSITIGKDFLCAWDVFISDSDWHSIKKNDKIPEHHKPIIIEDHVWVAPGCSILKGVQIGKGSIIGTQSVLINKCYPSNSLIAGSPARLIEENINWSRDIQ